MKLRWKYVFVLLSLNAGLVCSALHENSKKLSNPIIRIPNGLSFGAGTSAFQVEGALKTHGRSESFIEQFLSKRNASVLADISSDSYHRYKEDVKILKYIGLNFYRLSISWSRLLPTGYANRINREAVNYYHALLEELKKARIEPILELHHFDHPSVFEKFGGWTNTAIIKLFKNYATVIFKEFGHRVKYFLTFNEPNAFCNFFVSGMFNNRTKTESTFPRIYMCSHNILKAHAQVYHLYHNRFNRDKRGMISMNILCNDLFSLEKNDRYLDELAFAFGCGWFADPIFSKSGDYSETLKKRVKQTNRLLGRKKQLPTFSKWWIRKIRGTADYFGLSFYLSRPIVRAPSHDRMSWINFLIPPEARINLHAIATAKFPTSNPNDINPIALKRVLTKIKQRYNNPPVYIIENGFSDNGQLNDTDRIHFIYAHVKQAIEAIKEDQCNVKSYIYWSLIDNFEFEAGYRSHFGLAHIDFTSPNRTRTLKASAIWLRNVVRKRLLYIEE